MERRLYVTCPICGEEIQEDTTIYCDKSGDVVGCEWCMTFYDAEKVFEFYEDEGEEECRAADGYNDFVRELEAMSCR